MHFAITIDTEVDKSRDWSVAQDAGFEGIHRGVGEILHPLFVKYGVSPVYFLSNEVLADPELCKLFETYQIANTAELGTHLHYEAAGPLAISDIAGRKLDGVQAQLTAADERLALTWLTDTYKARFSQNPISFRAGRYGLSRNSIGLLAEMGYKVDSSATPGLKWDYQTSPKPVSSDYRQAPSIPYVCDSQNPSIPGSSGVLEVPISLKKAPLGPREVIRLALGKKRRWIWARPGFGSKSEFLRMIKTAAARKEPSDIMVMMFHNMEIVPGKSPYCSTDEDAAAYLDDLTYFIKKALQHGLSPVTLERYAKRFYARLF